jgi:CBS domain-containing protein
VAAAMRSTVPSCTLRTPVLEVARRMKDENLPCLVVVSHGSDLIAGTIGRREVLRAIVEGRTEAMASDVMSLDAPPTIGARDSLAGAVARLRDENVEAFVVVDGQPPRPVGMLTAAEVAALLARR